MSLSLSLRSPLDIRQNRKTPLSSLAVTGLARMQAPAASKKTPLANPNATDAMIHAIVVHGVDRRDEQNNSLPAAASPSRGLLNAPKAEPKKPESKKEESKSEEPKKTGLGRKRLKRHETPAPGEMPAFSELHTTNNAGFAPSQNFTAISHKYLKV